MTRNSVIILALLILVVPAMLLAADVGKRDAIRVGDVEFISNTEFTVPLEVTYDEELAAMDLPLTYSEGVTLTGVTFENTLVADFDEKIVNIDNENNRVNIGLINMVYAQKEQPTLKPVANGTPTVAVLHFTLDDINLQSLEIGHYKTKAPYHELMFVYNEYENGVPMVKDLVPALENSTVSLANRNPAAALPKTYELSQNTPNPFNPTTQVNFALPQSGEVKLAVYNVLGQHVTNLVDGVMNAGYHTVTWDGTDENGNAVSTGVYFVKMNVDGNTDTRRMTLIK
jgi:hypothetical protein